MTKLYNCITKVFLGYLPIEVTSRAFKGIATAFKKTQVLEEQ